MAPNLWDGFVGPAPLAAICEGDEPVLDVLAAVPAEVVVVLDPVPLPLLPDPLELPVPVADAFEVEAEVWAKIAAEAELAGAELETELAIELATEEAVELPVADAEEDPPAEELGLEEVPQFAPSFEDLMLPKSPEVSE